MERMNSSKLWWLNTPNTTKRSTWLQSTIKELDEKTVSMLKIIDEDADSFAQRADMYYMKRPQLMNMVQEFYRSHRSLAEKLYAAKLESNPLCQLDKFSFADTYDNDSFDDSDRFSTESEIDDPIEIEIFNDASSGTHEVTKLKEEIESLRREIEMKHNELMRKDEEKREVIRQLSFAVEMVKEENLILKKSLAAKSFNAPCKKWNFPELRKVFFIGI